MSATCPLCGDQTSKLINRFGIDEVAELFAPRMVSAQRFDRMRSILARLWQSSGVRVMRCEGCRFGFADPFTGGTAEFYQLEAPDTPYPVDKWEYRRTLKALAQRRPATTATLIDIGAGKGHFLSQLLGNGWTQERLAATEYSEAGRQNIETLGVRCSQCDIRDLDAEAEFDVVCMFQVLEHLDGIEALFGALRHVTRPGADLFIAVPNGERIDFNERLGLQYDCPPNHVSRWSPRSFEVLAARFGWSIEACELEPPPTVRQEAAYGAVNRYIRNSHKRGTWSRFTYGLADRLFARSGKANKLAKAAGMAVSPDIWVTAAKVAHQARNGGTPHALWVHFRRTD